ncbi:Probable splicing factor [Durusdinium trenchii]|uniref:Arginine/serine-rich 6 (CeSRp20) (RNA-binding protein srp-1) n=1 Tax=Durusdinium trenchii TaxID=1381693 RepID=A0ABP0LJC3_9DINO
MPTCRLYVGNLPKDRAVERNELEEHFEKFGRVVDIWVARQPPGFAFVTMDDEKEAQDAVKELDGAKVAGERIRVEVSKGGEPRRNPPPRRDSRSRSRGGGRGRRKSRRSPSYSDYSYSASRSRGRGRKRR